MIVFALFCIDMDQAYERVQARGTIVATRHGDVEYTENGAGPDVLVIHGSGGGYDQGELVARAVLGDGFHWIAPPRSAGSSECWRTGSSTT